MAGKTLEKYRRMREIRKSIVQPHSQGAVGCLADPIGTTFCYINPRSALFLLKTRINRKNVPHIQVY